MIWFKSVVFIFYLWMIMKRVLQYLYMVVGGLISRSIDLFLLLFKLLIFHSI